MKLDCVRVEKRQKVVKNLGRNKLRKNLKRKNVVKGGALLLSIELRQKEMGNEDKRSVYFSSLHFYNPLLFGEEE